MKVFSALCFLLSTLYPYRVVPDMVFDQNYIKVSVSGEKLLQRIATITCYTVDGKIPWTLEIKEKDLKW